jgi:Transposase
MTWESSRRNVGAGSRRLTFDLAEQDFYSPNEEGGFEPRVRGVPGLDVGKGEHHACALDPSGKKLHDRVLPNDEQRLRALFAQLSRHGRVLVVVDQPARKAARSPTCPV